MAGHIRCPRGMAVERLDGYEEGAWWVQDLAASLPVRILGSGEGRSALDLCAAPGGKTMQLAAARWQVTAVDMSARRMERLERNLQRSKLEASCVKADIMAWDNSTQYDAILLDAPCSATGTMRRHPDVLHRIGMRQINELAALQSAMLDRAAGWLKPGGLLVYATCSLEPHEGEAQVQACLERNSRLSLDPVRSDELPVGIAPDESGCIRTLPPMLAEQGGLDGFFIARFKMG
ncbi:MAG: RsmB/NOP family class I SAM-dependent RNA methyltransferase, partial [Sphingomonadales bacterium]|nr:RsmB/NOP family class I SAM-dependent RNA methyltransferase [Sphingomonadales bacterium]